MEQEIVRTADTSITVPELPTRLVRRPHLIETIEQIFRSKTDVICVEAPTGYGKTTLLLEFASFGSEPSFVAFLGSASRASHDQAFVRYDLAGQLHWFLRSVRLPDDADLTDGDLRNLWRRCATALTRQRRDGFVVVDGLHHIAAKEAGTREAILDLLPFGIRPFKVLLSGNVDEILRTQARKVRVKSLPISAFASHETDEFLGDIVADREKRLGYHLALAGVPYLLASVRRQLGADSERASGLEPEGLTDIHTVLQSEWDSLVARQGDALELVLACLVAHGGPTSAEALAELCGESSTDIDRWFQGLPFLAYSRRVAGWQFCSDQFRAFAESKLKEKVRDATGLIVTSLLKEPDSDESISRLPSYLDRLGNSELLMEWLNERRIVAILFRQRAVASLDPVLRTAATICHEGRNYGALTMYSLSRSILKEVALATGMEKEIRARGAVGDMDGALAVANSAPLLTQRARLLAVAVDALSAMPGFDRGRIVEEIREIVGGIDKGELTPEEAVDIATELYAVDAGLAVGLLKEATGEDVGEDSFEVAMASVSVAAFNSRRRSDDAAGRQGGGEAVPKDVPLDRKFRQFLNASMVFYQEKTGQEVLAATESVEDVSERLFIQRKWASKNPTRVGAITVVEAAVQDAITSASFTPNATFYREIATPLPYERDTERRRKLVAVLDGQRAVMQRQGPTVDFVRLQLCLARCDVVDGDVGRAVQRLENAYYTIEELTDLETRASCLAWFAGELSSLGEREALEARTSVGEVVSAEFEAVLGRVVEDGAEQLTALTDALQALAVHDPERAMAVALRLNTFERRDAALLRVAFTMCSGLGDRLDADLLHRVMERIEPGPGLDAAMELSARRVREEIAEGRLDVQAWKRVVAALGRCCSAGSRVRVLAEAVASLAEKGEGPVLQSQLEAQLMAAFDAVASPREKYDVACEMVAALQPACPELARTVFTYLEGSEPTMRQSEGVGRGLWLVMDLLTKAAFALGRRNDLQDDDVRRVCGAMDKVDEPVPRMELFSALGLYLWREGHTAQLEEVALRWIWPDLEALLENGDQSVRFAAWARACPVAWIYDKERCKEALATFPALVRNACFEEIAVCILNKQPPGEPFDDCGELKPRCTYSDLRRVLEVCEETDDDKLIYWVFERIGREASGKRQGGQLTRDQRADVSRRMVDIAERRLPMPERIAHDGYRVLCRAHALRVASHGGLSWAALIREGRQLPNAADRAYVLASLASCLPPKERRQFNDLLDDAESEAAKLETFVDQYDRYYVIADASLGRGIRASRAVECAFGAVRRSRSPEKARYERRLVDLAYRVDPELPAQLATLYDDDPARDEYRERTRNQVKRQQLKRSLDSRSGIDLSDLREGSDLAWACWNALGSLNSGRMVAAGIATFRDVIRYAGGMPLTESFPMYAWSFANVMERYRTAREGERYTREIFEAVLRSAHLFVSVLEHGMGVVSTPDWRYAEASETHIVVEEGERAKACEFIRDWLRNQGEEYVWIVDPYFGTDDLWLVTDILETCGDVDVKILTGKGVPEDQPGGIERAYRSAWNRLSDSTPPVTEVVVVRARKSRKAPFHDRYILSRGGGLRLGNSINSLGSRMSEISVFGGDQATALVRSSARLLNREAREFEGERLQYQMFEL